MESNCTQTVLDSGVTNQAVNLHGLKPHPQNYNRHPDRQVRGIAASLQKFGQPRSIVVWSGYILAGHGVVEAALSLGWAQLRADVLPDDYPGHLALAYVAADNELGRLSDPDEAALAAILDQSAQDDEALLEAIGYDREEFDDLLKRVANAGEPEAAGTDTDPEVSRADELRDEWGAELGQLWRLGPHRLMCGDCTDAAVVARLMGGERANFVFADPPYGYKYQSNMRTQSAQFDTLIGDDQIDAAFVHVANSVSDGWILTCTSWKVLAEWYPLLTFMGEMSNLIVWDKGGGGMGDLTHSLSTDYELIMAFGRGGEIEGARIGSVWDVGKDAASEYIHATQKPVTLVELAINTFGCEILYDPFAGSGTTIIAADNLNRVCRAVEISPAYCAVILQRYLDHTGTQPVLINDA